MTPERLAKIRAIANDSRGDVATRAVAQEYLRRHKAEPSRPRFRNVPDRRVHGLRRDPVYEYYVYADMMNWDQTKAGNPTYLLYRHGINYRIVLFKYKRSDAWGWMRVDDYHDDTVFSDRFSTMAEAQKDAWDSLMKN